MYNIACDWFMRTETNDTELYSVSFEEYYSVFEKFCNIIIIIIIVLLNDFK